MLSIRYDIEGNISEIVVPEQADRSSRKQDLWKDTCFEVFLGVKGSPGYWEFNITPEGHWNVFRFDQYREGGREETAYTSLPLKVKRTSELFVIETEINLAPIVQPEQQPDAAICAVIRKRDGMMTYWALAHQGPKPDFHRREDFVVELF